MFLEAKGKVVVLVIAVLFSLSVLAQSVEEVKQELLHMMELDQQGREELLELENEFGRESKQVKSAWEEQRKIDSKNVAKLEEIIEDFGWPGITTFGREAATSAFLILQHAELGTQKEYLSLFREAVNEGEARGSSYALLYDRILMREGKKQLYGSQLKRDKATGHYYVWPIHNEESLEKRRRKMKMMPMKEYLKLFPFEVKGPPEKIKAKDIN